jgi:hypothetical protein
VDGADEIVVGVADAMAEGTAGSAILAVEWKSDVDPCDTTVAAYAGHLRCYLSATGIPLGVLVFLTSGRAVRVQPPLTRGPRQPTDEFSAGAQ